jgi:predicted dehydrogenase
MRLALVGYGRIAPKHLEVFRGMGCEFVACCNRSAEGREKATREGGIQRTYATIDEMLKRERPDGVISCASIDQVFATAQQILPFGIPTLLEKPPGTSLAEFDELENLAARHGTPVMVGLNRRNYTVLRNALADAGGLEAVTAVFVEWSEDPGHCLRRGLSEHQVERMIFGNSLHGLDLLAQLAGAVTEPSVLARNLGDPFRWLMSLQGISDRGVLATFQSTWDSPGGWRLTFCTPGRRYTFAPLETCQMSESGSKEVRHIEPDECDRKFKPGFFGQAAAFLKTIRAGMAPAGQRLADSRPAMVLAQHLTQACVQPITHPEVV